MRIFGQWSELVRLVFRKNANQVTLEPAAGTAASDDVTYRLPADAGPATIELTTNTSTQTLTNKTIDADSNTITNIENADIKAGAAIDTTKIAVGSVSNTEFQYLDGVTSGIQGQIDGKQPLDADLTALAGVASDGLLTKTGAGTAVARTLTAGSSKISVTNGDGVAGNPTVDVTEANLTLNNISGVLSISKGGTGINAASAVSLFNQLDPLTTKGDILTNNGTDSIRVGVGTNGQVLKANSAVAAGVEWAAESGLPPVTSMTDALATQLGYKVYEDGTTYNGGNAPTVAYTVGPGSLSSILFSSFRPYQTQSGNWRLAGEFTAQMLTTEVREEVSFTINSVTSSTVQAQPVIATASPGRAPVRCRFLSTGAFQIALASGTTNIYYVAFDVELGAKPNWAY